MNMNIYTYLHVLTHALSTPLLLPRQSAMQNMLPHAQTDQRARNSKPKHKHPNAPERLNIDAHDPVPPPSRQMVDVAYVVPDPADHIRRVGRIAVFGPQPALQDVLEHGRGEGDADRAAGGAERVGCGGDDGLVFVAHGREQREEGDREHGPVAHAAEEEVDEGGPDGQGRGEGGCDERGGGHAQGLRAYVHPRVFPRGAHDEAGA